MTERLTNSRKYLKTTAGDKMLYTRYAVKAVGIKLQIAFFKRKGKYDVYVKCFLKKEKILEVKRNDSYVR